MKADAGDVAALEQAIADNPKAGAVIPGLARLRKIRFAVGPKGKRGGGRAIYFLMLDADTAVVLVAYAKADRANLSPDQKKALLDLVKELKG